jgi:hypothetical protein
MSHFLIITSHRFFANKDSFHLEWTLHACNKIEDLCRAKLRKVVFRDVKRTYIFNSFLISNIHNLSIPQRNELISINHW